MRSWIALPCAALVLSGCPASEKNGGENGQEPLPGVDGAAVVVASCDYFARCESTLGRFTASTQECQEVLTGTESCGGVRFDNTQAEADACVTWIESSACTWTILDASPDREAGPCGILRYVKPGAPGQVGPGKDCSTYGCVQGYYCTSSIEPYICRICVALGGAGETCNYDWQCQDMLHCYNNQCEAWLQDGSSCTADDECQSGYCIEGTCGQPLERGVKCVPGDRCRAHLVCLGGTCTDRLGTGATCERDNECLIGSLCLQRQCTPSAYCGTGALGDACKTEDACGSGLYCDRDRVCAPHQGQGGDCEGNLTACPAPLVCRHSDYTCQPRGNVSDPCGDRDDCIDGLYCHYGTGGSAGECAEYVAAGGSCESWQACVEGYFCDTTTWLCTALLANGEPCVQKQQCQSGYCYRTCVECTMP